MEPKDQNIFEDLVEKDFYIDLKSHLYNYCIRKKTLRKIFAEEKKRGLTLETGCGISPILPSSDQIIYSDISLRALQILKASRYDGRMVVADAMNLPLRSDVFQHIICSEVIEHLSDDTGAVKEFARIMKKSGALFITFPHRKVYFSVDDRYVHHYRRYELSEIEKKLSGEGLRVVKTRKILGPLEKITMTVVIACLGIMKNRPFLGGKGKWKERTKSTFLNVFRIANTAYSALVRLDAVVMPRSLSSVLLVKAEKREDGK